MLLFFCVLFFFNFYFFLRGDKCYLGWGEKVEKIVEITMGLHSINIHTIFVKFKFHFPKFIRENKALKDSWDGGEGRQ